jgi:hypothetical protein
LQVFLGHAGMVLAWTAVTALPHLVTLAGLTMLTIPVGIASWITVATTGRLPGAFHAFGTGVVTWYARLAAYLRSLTDEYPPFSLRTTAGPARRSTYVTLAAMGLVSATLVGGFVAFVLIFVVGFSGTHVVVEVPLTTCDPRGSPTPGRSR